MIYSLLPAPGSVILRAMRPMTLCLQFCISMCCCFSTVIVSPALSLIVFGHSMLQSQGEALGQTYSIILHCIQSPACSLLMHHQRDILVSRVAGLVLVPECLQRPVKLPVYDIHIPLLRLHKTHALSQGFSWRQCLLGRSAASFRDLPACLCMNSKVVMTGMVRSMMGSAALRRKQGNHSLTFSPRGFAGIAMGAPTMNLKGALLGNGVMPYRPTTR